MCINEQNANGRIKLQHTHSLMMEKKRLRTTTQMLPLQIASAKNTLTIVI